MQFELNCDFKTNIDMFPVFQEYFRTHQPPASLRHQRVAICIAKTGIYLVQINPS